jgi:hypothetical protein
VPTFTLADAGELGGGRGTGVASFATSTPSVCLVDSATGVVSVIRIGVCELTASRAGDSNYNTATSETVVLTIERASQEIVPVLSDNSIVFGDSVPTFTLAEAGLVGGGQGTGAASFATSTPSVCSIDAATGVLNVLTAGECELTATREGDLNYSPANSGVFTLSISKADQEIVPVLSDDSIAYGDSVPTFTLAEAGELGGGRGTGVASFATSTPSVCSVDAATGVLNVLTAGDCELTATRAGDSNYNTATSEPVVLTISKISQVSLVASVSPSAISSAETSQVTVPESGQEGGGNGEGSLSFAVDQSTTASCSVDSRSGLITPKSLSQLNYVCKVVATRAGDSIHLPQTSNTVEVSITRALPSQAALTAKISLATVTLSSGKKPVVSVPKSGKGSGSGSGSITYRVSDSSTDICSVDAKGNVTGLLSGVCEITAIKSGGTTYAPQESNVVRVTFTKVNQAPLNVSVVPSLILYAPDTTARVSVPATGPGSGSGNGAVTYSVDPTSAEICSVNDQVVTVLAVGDCKLVANKAGTTIYEPAVASTVLVIQPGIQAPLIASISEDSVPWNTNQGVTVTVPESGEGSGSGTGEVTYRSTTPDLCSVNTNGLVKVLAYEEVGNCFIVAVKAADELYAAQISDPVQLEITKTEQNELEATIQNASLPIGGKTFVSTPKTGEGSGAGSGSVTYTVTPDSSLICSVKGSSGEVEAKSVGTCVIVATKASDKFYDEQTSNEVSVEVEKLNQEIEFTVVDRMLTEKSFKPSATTNSGLAVTYTMSIETLANCVWDAKNKAVKLLQVGPCTVEVNALGNSKYYDAVSQTETFQIIAIAKKLTQTLSHTPPPRTILTADDTVLDAVLSSGITPVVTVSKLSASICRVDAGVMKGLKPGVCNYTIAGPAQGAYLALAAKSFTTSFYAEDNETTIEYPTGVSESDPREITITTELLPVEGLSSQDLDVTYSTANSSICWIDANQELHLSAAGTCAITATSGGGDYLVSSDTKSFRINKAPQELTFTNPGDLIEDSEPQREAPEATAAGTGFKLSAVLDSGLQPVFRSLDETICSVEEGGAVTWNGDLKATPPADTCQIGISHPGNAGYLPLAEEVVSVTVPTDDVEVAPAGGVVREAGVIAALPRSGGTVSKGGVTFAVGITSKTFIVKPQSKGLYTGPITADIQVSYMANGETKIQTCSTTFGIAAKNTKGKIITVKSQETKASISAVTAKYRKMPKWGAKGYLAPKTFTNSASCTLNKEAFAYFKAGGSITAKAIVVRDRRWPTTYARQKPQGTPIYPTRVEWDLEIG